MERLWKLNIERPFQHHQSGQFVSPASWKHRKDTQAKDFGIIIGFNKSIYIQVEDLQYKIQPGEVLLISPEVTYFGYKPSELGTSFFWLHFCPREKSVPISKERFIDHLMAFDIGTHNPSINNAIFLPTFFRLTYTDKPFILIKQILDIANASYYSTFATDYLITELLIELTQQYQKQLILVTANPNENSQKFSQILEWIRLNICSELSVKEIADRFSFNPDHLTRVFKKNLGMSTIKYINTLKLNHAKELLSTTNKSIKEISYLVNFKDEKYFMKLFKNYEGITPSQFRDSYTKTFYNNI
jgi:AraC-like DNA-binding protein